jgi:1,4-dihydroxy-2-naphthoate octaprenyltransferase
MHTWVLAARPKTLYAAIAPVIVGSAVAFHDGVFRVGPALAALLGAIFIQIGTNFANDVADFQRGADTSERLGPVRVTQAGLLTSQQVLKGMWVAFGIAGLMGVYLFFTAGWPVLVIGALSVVAGIAYTAGPLPLAYYGLGDVAVFLFFGVAAVGGTYFVQAETITTPVIWSAVPMGLLSTAILVVNNLRDIATDKKAGKYTLAVRIGRRWTQIQYTLLLFVAYMVPIVLWWQNWSSPWVLLTWLSLPLAISLIRRILADRGAALNRSLAGTGQLELVFGLLFALGWLI